MAPLTVNTEVRDEGFTNYIDDAWLKEIFGMEDCQFDSYMPTV